MKVLIPLIIFMFGSGFTQAQESNPSCEIMHEGTFKDLDDEDPSAYFVIEGDSFIDYSNNGLKVSKSTIVWEDDCTYSLTLEETNISELKPMVGFQLKGRILNIDGHTITYEQILANETIERTLVKLHAPKSSESGGQIEVFSEILIF